SLRIGVGVDCYATRGPAVEPAFLERGGLPPPASAPGILARSNGTRARRAADARIAAIVERVVRHVVRAHVAPDLVRRPIGERIEFRQSMERVELFER